MVGAAAIFHHRWGKIWPSKVTCMLQGFADHAPLNPAMFEMLQDVMPKNPIKPELGVAFLHTPSHWMMAIHTGDVLLALDGYHNKEGQQKILQPLAAAAAVNFEKVGLNITTEAKGKQMSFRTYTLQNISLALNI
jgi:hypothetical protein